jgi:hypothetical protein
MSQNSPHCVIGMVIFPRMTQLDFTGPFEVFARVPGTQIHVLWKKIEPVVSDTGLAILPPRRLVTVRHLISSVFLAGRDRLR